MKFDAKEKILCLSAEELVLSASAHFGKGGVDGMPLRLPARPEDGEDVTVYTSFALPSFSGRVEARAAQRREEGEVFLTARFYVPSEKRGTECTRLLRALGFLLSYAFTEECTPAFRFYLEDEAGEATLMTEHPDAHALEEFFAKLLLGLLSDAECEIERVTVRLPSFLSTPFPYKEVREGQRDMMSGVFSAAKRGEILFATAPTGTGKTMAALFPAMRALGHGYVRKVFYLTPKNTSALAAVDGIQALCEAGMHIRALHLEAKEKICAERQTRGECGRCRRRSSAEKRLREAIEELCARALPVTGRQTLSELAVRYGTCPYRLALAYAKYADVVIGDYNYLFDLQASPDALYCSGEDRLFLVDEAHNLPARAREMYSGRVDTAFFENALAVYGENAGAKAALERLSRGFLRTVDFLLKDDVRQAEDGQVYGFARSANFPSAFEGVLHECIRRLEKEKGSEKETLSREQKSVRHALVAFAQRLSYYNGRYLTYAKREGEQRELCFFCIDPSERVCERLSLGRGTVFFSATLAPLDYYRSVLCGTKRTEKLELPSPFENGALCVGIMDKISVRAAAREETLPEIARVIVTAMKPRRGNYMVFCPSYEYMDAVADAFHALTPKTPMARQKRHMTGEEREAFLAGFTEQSERYFVGFAVSGGIFSEGIDLVGKRLIGTVVVGVGLPGISPEGELISSYYGDLNGEGKEYAYLYPGLNRILQAAGRVIRREEDRGIAVLIDDRLHDEACRNVFPSTWHGLKYVGDRTALTALLTRFWNEVDRENENNHLHLERK